MKPKIKLGKKYRTASGGFAVGHYRNKDGTVVGRFRRTDWEKWYPIVWDMDGTSRISMDCDIDIPKSRIVMVPVEVPDWARSVLVGPGGDFAFSPDPPYREWMPIDDWIASLEADDESS